MADQGSIANLKQNIDDNIYQNTDYDITGGRMNTVLQNIVDTLKFNGRDFFNVNEYREKSDAYADAAAGRAAVPDEVKKLGLVITYLLADGWYIDQFIGSNISGWETASNWKVLGPISISQNAETGQTDITIGGVTTPFPSIFEVEVLKSGLGYVHIEATMQSGKYYNPNGEEVINAGSIYSGQIDISSLKAKSIIIAFNANNVSASGRYLLITDNAGNVLDSKPESSYSFLNNGVAYLVLSSDSIASSAYISMRDVNTLIGVWKWKDYSNDIDEDEKVLKEVNSISGLHWKTGYYIAVDGTIVPNAGTRAITDFIPCPQNSLIEYIAETDHQDVCGISFWDINRNFISGVQNNASLNALASTISPVGTAYCILSCKGADGNTPSVCTLRYNEIGVSNTIQKLKENIPIVVQSILNGTTTNNLFSSEGTLGLSSVSRNGVEWNINAGGYLFYNLGKPANMDSFVRVAFELVSGNLAETYCRLWNGKSLQAGEPTYNFIQVGNYYYVDVPKTDFTENFNVLQLRIDARNTGVIKVKNIEINIDTVFVNINQKEKFAYVAENGSDVYGVGSYNYPYATVTKALESGANHIFMKGGVYKQRISLENSADEITIEAVQPRNRVIFVAPDAMISNSETLLEGTTKVYTCPCDIDFAETNKWIFQDNVADESTLITDAERNPYERGKEYRCDDTKIELCNSTTLADAINEIENSSTFKWYIDNGILYFSRPQAVNNNNPLMYSSGGSFITNTSRVKTLNIRGIETKYMIFNVDITSSSLIEDCKSSNIWGSGAFVYNQCLSVKFLRCEAVRAFYGNTGDGFNGHSINDGDIFSKQTTCLLFDCWSHDNNDDGYSDHERSEIEIWGGLFEYNGKAGVTPSYGSHCSCYNVISRRNYNGFWYVGEVAPEEGGKYGQMLCIGCVAENNGGAGQSGIGFGVTASGNKATVISCKSINNSIGYYAGANTLLEMIDCGSLGNTDIKYGDGTFTIKNTSIVS